MAFISEAQQDDVKARRAYRPNAYWLNLRYDHYLNSGSFLYFENSTRFTSNYIPLGAAFPFKKIYQMYFMGGYEHKASEHWYLGLSEKILLDPGINTYFTRLNLSHRGKISSLRFIKEGAFEFIKYPKSDNPNVVNQNYGRVSFLPSLIKEFKVADKKCYALVSYRAYIIFDLLNDGLSSYDKRRIDKTELKFELDCFVTNRLLVSLFALRDTDYSYSLGLYDSSGQPVIPAGPINRITPTFGLGLNYVFNAPDDFVPGFPVK